jgi:hypothetical protein
MAAPLPAREPVVEPQAESKEAAKITEIKVIGFIVFCPIRDRSHWCLRDALA